MLPERFWAKVDKTASCWLWTAGLDHRGYGRYRLPHGHVGAHRASYIDANGPIPETLDVCHNCPGGDNPRCVNPAHLWLGTHADNMRDMREKGTAVNPPRVAGDQHWTRQHPERVRSGINHPRAKFSDSLVAEIRADRADNGTSLRKLAAAYGMSLSHVAAIVAGTRR